MTAVRLAIPADRDRIVATVVAAFDEDPAFRTFFGSDPDFGALATAYVAASTMKRTAVNAVWVGADREAVAMWTPPAGTVEIPPITADLPSDVVARLAEYDDAVHAVLPAGGVHGGVDLGEGPAAEELADLEGSDLLSGVDLQHGMSTRESAGGLWSIGRSPPSL